MIKQAIEARTLSEQERLLEALKKLVEEDPTFHIINDENSGQIIINGIGELHIEVMVDRLKREFGIEVRVGNPEVSYRETITNEVQCEGMFDRSSGKNMFGWVKVKLEPALNEGLVVKSDIVDKKIPKELIEASLSGAREALNVGVKGFPLVDVKVSISDIKYEENASVDVAYKIAASTAVKDAIRMASPVLLEPIFLLEVVSPEVYVGDIIADINSKRGQIESIENKDVMQVLKGMVPLSEMFGYVTKLRSVSQGRASYTMAFSHYKPV
jgi:elongation factor G